MTFIEATLVFPLTEHAILLGIKKTGPRYFIGFLNGFGGKVEARETVEAAAVRELRDESELFTQEHALIHVGVTEFYIDEAPSWRVYVFLVRQWTGSPKETAEMIPEWFPLNKIPYERMLPADQKLLPAALSPRESPFLARVNYTKKDNKLLLNFWSFLKP